MRNFHQQPFVEPIKLGSLLLRIWAIKNESSQTSHSFPLFSVSVEQLGFEVYTYQVQFWEMFLSNQVIIIHFWRRSLLTEWKQVPFKNFFSLNIRWKKRCIRSQPTSGTHNLMRKEGESAKSINEMLLSRLSRYRASPSATLASLHRLHHLQHPERGPAGWLPFAISCLPCSASFSSIYVLRACLRAVLGLV